jgi:C-terminal processing protease CtpA/Prc
MRSYLLLSLAALACASRSPAASAGTGTGEPQEGAAASAPAADSCRDLAAAHAPDPGCGNAPLCSPDDRVRVACELRDALEARYVFFNLKAKLLDQLPALRPPPAGEETAAPAEEARFDSRAHLDGCVAAERAVGREDDPLRFLDRLRRCTAAFQDGHLFLTLPRAVPTVALGVRLRRAGDGHVYVAYRDPGVARWLDGRADEPTLAVGDEVVAVDGRPVADVLAELAELVPGSSPGARLERAADALTRRDFDFPERRQALLTVATDGALHAVSLPWLVSPNASGQPLAAGYLKRTGLTSSDRVDWRTDAKGAWLREGGAEGLVRGDAIVSPEAAAQLTAYRGEWGQLAARLGELAGDGTPFCYAQLLTFHTETLAAGSGAARPLPDVLRDFVLGCQERKRDLVLDLRQNEGGYLSHSSALAALLTPAGSMSPGGALLLRATAQNEKVYRERSPMLGSATGPARGQAPTETEQILTAIRDARRTHDEFTPAFLEAPLRPGDGPAFGGRVVALISPGCMSACDRLAGLLRQSGRAVLVGGPTEGAGASQQESKDQSARWVDTGGFVGVSIPNAAMGVQVAAASGVKTAPAQQFFERLAFENRPVQPDVPYATARHDVVEHNAGWLAATLAALGRPRPEPERDAQRDVQPDVNVTVR